MRPAGRTPSADPAISEPGELFELGRIVNRHGIQGEVRLLPHCADSDALAAGSNLWLRRPDGALQCYRIAALRPHKRFFLLQLEGVTTANDAEALIGSTVAVPRAQLPPLAPEAVYHIDLIGCAVRTTTGEELGTVAEMIVTGSNDVCVVQGAGREYLIPLVADVVAELDPTARTIVVRPLPGLLDA